MTEKEHIKIVRCVDGEDRVITVNGKVLKKHEIIDLVVKLMEENHELNDENESLERRLKSTVEMLCVLNRSNKKQEEQNEQLKEQNERLKLKLERERCSHQKQHEKGKTKY